MAYVNLSALAKNDRSASLNSDIGNAAILEIYTGSYPATPDTANTGTLLVTLTCATPFGTVTNAVLTAGAVTSNTAIATGTAGWARLYKANGTTGVMDFDVGTSGTSVIIASTSISSGSTISVSSIVITEQ